MLEHDRERVFAAGPLGDKTAALGVDPHGVIIGGVQTARRVGKAWVGNARDVIPLVVQPQQRGSGTLGELETGALCVDTGADQEIPGETGTGWPVGAHKIKVALESAGREYHDPGS